MRPFGSAYLVSPCSSAPFRWGRRSCLGLRTGVSPHFSMNSMREILALRGGYERGRIPLPSPMPPESGAPPHNTHPSMVSLRHPRRSCPLFVLALALSLVSFSHTHIAPDRSPFFILRRGNSPSPHGPPSEREICPATDTTVHATVILVL